VRIGAVARVRDCLAVSMFHIVTDLPPESVPSGTPVPGRPRNLDSRRGWRLIHDLAGLRPHGRRKRVTNSVGLCEISFESRVVSPAAIRARDTPVGAGISSLRAPVCPQVLLRTADTSLSGSDWIVRLSL
jgi:hypothetical protein